MTTKITGGIVVSTLAFGHGPFWRGRLGDPVPEPPAAYTSVALPRLCRGRAAGYHWDNCWSRRIDPPFSCAGLAELHEHTVARVLAGTIALAPACPRCGVQRAGQRRGAWYTGPCER